MYFCLFENCEGLWVCQLPIPGDMGENREVMWEPQPACHVPPYLAGLWSLFDFTPAPWRTDQLKVHLDLEGE